MVTPAVLISAAGTLVFSTSTRLARIVDRARSLTKELEELDGQAATLAPEEVALRRAEIELQIGLRARRSHLVQTAVTCFYLALGFFVGTTVALAGAQFWTSLAWLPGILGVLGTTILFGGSVQLIRETRLAIRAVDSETAATQSRLARRKGAR
jgi:hypothetical protein